MKKLEGEGGVGLLVFTDDCRKNFTVYLVK